MTQETENLRDVVDEYLRWRKVNPHIKGGENYLKRLARARVGKGEAKPAEMAELTRDIAEAIGFIDTIGVNRMLSATNAARAILARYNVSEKGE